LLSGNYYNIDTGFKLDEVEIMEELKGLTSVTGKNIKPAALTLAKAFQDYPVSRFFEPDDEKRRKSQPRTFRDVLKMNLKHGAVYGTSPKMEGVAVWILVDKTKPAPPHRRTLRELFEALFGDKEKQKKRQALFTYSQEVRNRVLPEHYWYLQLLGVDPDCQRQGWASRLLKPMLEIADRDGLPCFLETQQPRNVSLYGHFGFLIVEEGTIPMSDVYSWAMVRKK
jgi:ribosomal protein S18 acetylase RimI-like enzyme